MAEALANDNPAAIAAEIEAQRRAAVHQRLAAKAGPLRRSVVAFGTLQACLATCCYSEISFCAHQCLLSLCGC